MLLADLDAAMLRLRTAQEEFHKVLNDVSSGLPPPYGSFLLHQAALTRRQTLYGLKLAVERHTNFVLHGIVPKDLREKPLDSEMTKRNVGEKQTH